MEEHGRGRLAVLAAVRAKDVMQGAVEDTGDQVGTLLRIYDQPRFGPKRSVTARAGQLKWFGEGNWHVLLPWKRLEIAHEREGFGLMRSFSRGSQPFDQAVKRRLVLGAQGDTRCVDFLRIDGVDHTL